MLLVENELAVDGWHTNTTQVNAVNASIPLRAWTLSPGRYRFTTTFQEPGRSLQYIALAVTLIAWLGCILMLVANPFSPKRRRTRAL
jgi:hypothetical protein